MLLQYNPVGGGFDGLRCDRRFVFSRFKPLRTFKDPNSEETFTASQFSADSLHVLLGSYTGELKVYNAASGQEDASHACHSSAITHLQQSKDGELLLTCSDYVRPMSALWRCRHGFLDQKMKFEEDTYLEFGESSSGIEDRAVGTNQFQATVYDLNSGQEVVKLYDEASANRYSRNRAHFHPEPGSNIILNDGALWDLRTSSILHKFDKLNPHNSGVFHPRGQQVIINTEVWDMRSLGLLHTVPALDQCKLVFSSTGDIIYGVVAGFHEDEFFQDVPTNKTTFATSFRTLDATDYSQIATVETRRVVLDLAADTNDTHIAIIEAHGSSEEQPSPADENLCRLWEVGKLKAEDEDAEEQEDVEDEDMDLDEDDDPEEILSIIADGEDSSAISSSSDSSGSSDSDSDEESEEEEENVNEAHDGPEPVPDDGDPDWVDADDEEEGNNLDVTYDPEGMSD